MGHYHCIHCDETKESRSDGYHEIPGPNGRPAEPYCDSCFDTLECDWCGQVFEYDEADPINHNGRLFHSEMCRQAWLKDIQH